MKSPIINSPYFEPTRYFEADDRGLTDNIIEKRRPSSYYIPVPQTRAKNKQLGLEITEGAYGKELQKENEYINKVRMRIGNWRSQNYPGITKTSRDLLAYWKDETRENKLFFCQIESLETLIFITEVAEKLGDAWVINEIKSANEQANPGLYRIAFKMATGSGKTVVMAMIIAYHTLNKIRYPQDTRFTDAFAIITPGITIRDRLNVLLPNDPKNYYRERDIVSYQDMDLLQQANVFITNYHQLETRQNPRFQVGAVMKAAGLLKDEAMKETPSAMVSRAFKSILNRPRVLVINDEAHHCYREKPNQEVKLVGEEREEADENNKAARVWISGIEALSKKTSINAVIDLSATPYFLSGSGYQEGTMFPWVAYDFSLIDALESGIVKIPRLPVESDTIKTDESPEFRNLWLNIKDFLPKKGMKTGNYDLSTLDLPTKLSEALLSLYGNYSTYYEQYLRQKKDNPAVMPPVMIIVCNNTTVSEIVYRWISGYERPTVSGQIKLEKGNLEIFRNENGVQMVDRQNTLLIDSVQIDSGEKINDDFKKIFSKEIEDFHKDYKKRFPGRDDPTDEELLREVMNTVGKPGKLGENIKCVVSVSMLTEGWDVNSVTHVLGVRAFSTQLLCEQVIGRALRRMDYSTVIDPTDGIEKFTPEYAEVYGVPFNFLKAEGKTTPQPPKVIHRVHSIPEREKYEITFPRVDGYRYELNETKLAAKFTEESKIINENEPTEIISTGVIGEEIKEEMDKVKERREGEVAIRLTQAILKKYYVDADGNEKYWLTPQIRRIVDEYVKNYVVLKDRMVIGYLSVGGYRSGAITKIQQAIIHENIDHQKDKRILPVLAAYDTIGSTRYIDFLTTKEVQETSKSHINYVVADTQEWEQGVATKLEQMPEVLAYVKNQNLGFTIPYEHEGMSHQYVPDFIVVLEMPDKSKLNLLIEVTGKKDDMKGMKVKTTRDFWIPAVNNIQKFGKWAIIEIQDIHETQNLIRAGIERGFENLVPDNLFTEKKL